MLLQSIGGQADSISLNTALAAYSNGGEWIRLTKWEESGHGVR